MRFISPKTDFAFKRIFGAEESSGILKSFLNAILYEGRPVIEELEILDPYLAPRIHGVKDTYVDVRARLSDGRLVIIEMQVLNVEGLEQRVLYNAAKLYSTQLLVGQDYASLNPVIALTITDFVMFGEWAEVRSRFVLTERQRLMEYPGGDLELVFVELPKFKKGLEELESLSDKWLFFLRQARDLQAIPERMEGVPELKEAFGRANLAALTPEELDILERKEMFIHDQRNALVKAHKEGLAAGWAEGRAEGRAEGERRSALAIAANLLGRLSDAEVAEATGLSRAEIEGLHHEPLSHSTPTKP